MVLDPLAYVQTRPGEPFGEYLITPPALGEVEQKALSVLKKVLSAAASFNQLDLSFLGEHRDEFVTLVRDSISRLKPKRMYSPAELLEIAEDIYEDLKIVDIDSPYVAIKSVYDSLGLGDIEFLLYDPQLEDIVVNGYDKPVFVYHVHHGVLRTNITPGAELRRIVRRISSYLGARSGFYFLDGRLPDGSRVSVASESVSDGGPSFTIRKFRRERFTLLDILRTGTLSTELAAYLWLAVEGMGIAPQNVIISGGTGSGKTTTLNALLDLVPLPERIVTIEDTRELHLIHPNWLALTTEGTDGALVDALLSALRMRPDRIIVGEVRGPEAETLLAAMNVGHRAMGTLHANSARDTLRRLSSPPMNVPREMLPVINVVVVQHRIHIPGRGTVRRVTEVAELSPLEGGVNISPVFRWNPRKDAVERTEVPSVLLDRLSEYAQVDKREVKKELETRKRVLELALRSGLSRKELISLVNTYYYNPEKLRGRLG